MKTLLGWDGVVFKMSEVNFKRMCRDFAENGMSNPLDFGARIVGTLDYDLNEMDDEDFRNLDLDND